MCVCVCTCVCLCLCVSVCVRVCVCVHTHTHTYIHTGCVLCYMSKCLWFPCDYWWFNVHTIAINVKIQEHFSYLYNIKARTSLKILQLNSRQTKFLFPLTSPDITLPDANLLVLLRHHSLLSHNKQRPAKNQSSSSLLTLLEIAKHQRQQTCKNTEDMVQGPNQGKYGLKGTRAGKMEDRKEERERGKKEQRKNATCGEGNNNCSTPWTERRRRAEINYSQKTVPHSEHNPCPL